MLINFDNRKKNMFKEIIAPPGKKRGEGDKKVKSDKKTSGNKSPKKYSLFTLISILVNLALTIFVIIYLITGRSIKDDLKIVSGPPQESDTEVETVEEEPAAENEGEIAGETDQETAKNTAEAPVEEVPGEEEPADYLSFPLFDFNNETDLAAWNELAEATTYALKAELTTEQNVNGTSVLALAMKTDQGEFTTANWEITKDFKGLDAYVGAETGIPTQGKLRLKVWAAKDSVKSIGIFLGNDPNSWIRYVIDQSSMEDQAWTKIVLDLTQPKDTGGTVDWTYVDWGRVIITPNPSNPQNTS